MDKYSEERQIGRGASGTVLLCRLRHAAAALPHLTAGQIVVIKSIQVESLNAEQCRAAVNEGRILALLHHPNIVRYYEHFVHERTLRIVMEFCPGGTLIDYLAERTSSTVNVNAYFSETQVLNYFVQLLLGLEAVHSKQILHRDIKTSNILLDESRNLLKLSDFGISTVLTNSRSQAESIVGTPYYLSPELCEGKTYNQKSDIWSLGCVLYEMCALRRVFEADTLHRLVLHIMQGRWAAPLPSQFSRELRSLVTRMLDLDPTRRPTVFQLLSEPLVVSHMFELFIHAGSVTLPLQVLTADTRLHRTATEEMSLCQLLTWGAGSSLTCVPQTSNNLSFTGIALGRTAAAAILRDGRLLTWNSFSFLPHFEEALSRFVVRHISCGDCMIGCVTDRGLMFTWGAGCSGCLGHGDTRDQQQPQLIESLLGQQVCLLSCGSAHVLAATFTGSVYSWGRSDDGRLGLPDVHVGHVICSPQLVPLMGRGQSVESSLPKMLLAGTDCSALILSSGRTFLCGSNRNNKLGLTLPMPSTSLSFTDVHSLSERHVVDIKFGLNHTAALTRDHILITMGSDSFGQLASSHHELLEERFTKIACGDVWMAGLTIKGRVLTWGKAARGRLGNMTNDRNVNEVFFNKFQDDKSNVGVAQLLANHSRGMILLSNIKE